MGFPFRRRSRWLAREIGGARGHPQHPDARCAALTGAATGDETATHPSSNSSRSQPTCERGTEHFRCGRRLWRRRDAHDVRHVDVEPRERAEVVSGTETERPAVRPYHPVTATRGVGRDAHDVRHVDAVTRERAKVAGMTEGEDPAV